VGIIFRRSLSRARCGRAMFSLSRDKLGSSWLSPRDPRVYQTAAYSARLVLPSPPLGLPDGTRSGRRRGRRPLVDPPFGEGPRGLVP
jgi:hypothetical protein